MRSLISSPRKFAVAAIPALALCTVLFGTPRDVEAANGHRGHRHSYGYRQSFGNHGHYGYRPRFQVRYYSSYPRAYGGYGVYGHRSYYAPRWHDTSHYDWHDTSHYDWHGDHYDYHPSGH